MSATGEPTRLGLEVRFDEQPIHGRLYDDARLDRAFSGWLGLIAALEEAAGTAPARDLGGAES
ncbi:MAG TPA: hypothetical protein VGW10_15885 [Solirubrobacteraceae bacterium]|nr:hypothetical protein [Solirubrobacteraceae bacterium]